MLPKELHGQFREKFGLSSDSHCSLMSSVSVEGCRLSTNSLMVLVKSEDGTPLFVKHILHHVGLIIVCGTLFISEKSHDSLPFIQTVQN